MQCRTQINQRADVLEPSRGICQDIDRLTEQIDRLVSVDGTGERAQPGTARSREVDPVSEREVPLGERTSRLEIALDDESLAEVDAPRSEARVADAKLVPALGRREQVGLGIGVLVLGKPQTVSYTHLRAHET